MARPIKSLDWGWGLIMGEREMERKERKGVMFMSVCMDYGTQADEPGVGCETEWT